MLPTKHEKVTSYALLSINQIVSILINKPHDNLHSELYKNRR